MIQRATGPQCLSSRVSALADGSLPDDVRDRALAHVTSCPDCRADLDAERLVRDRLQAVATPQPSASLVAALLAMGETGGPVPPRPGYLPGSARPRTATIRREPVVDSTGGRWSLPGRRPTSRRWQPPARPGPTSRPGGRGVNRRRTVVGATAGALGVGVVAAVLASGLPAAPRVEPPDGLRAQAADAGADRAVSFSVNVTLSTPAFPPPAAVLTAQTSPVEAATTVDLTARDTAWTRAGAVPGVTATFLHHLVGQRPADRPGRSSQAPSGGSLTGLSP